MAPPNVVQALLEKCNAFILDTSDQINLSHLMDAVNTTIPDHESQDWKTWSSYMEILSEAWQRKFKEDEDIPWPQVDMIIIQFYPTKIMLTCSNSPPLVKSHLFPPLSKSHNQLIFPSMMTMTLEILIMCGYKIGLKYVLKGSLNMTAALR